MIPVFAPLAGVLMALYFTWKFVGWLLRSLRSAGREVAQGFREARRTR